MTDLESFRATTAHRRPGRVLYHGSFTDDLHRRVVEHIGTTDVGRHYGFFANTGIPIRRPADLPPIDYTSYWQGEELPPGTRLDGNGVAMAPAGFYHFWGYISPLRHAKSLREIETYPLDDLGPWDFSYMRPLVEQAHAAGRVTSGFVGHMYESAWQIRGYEEFLIDTVERPAWAECLLERLAGQNRVKAEALSRAGVDLIHCGDDVASQKALMFSPDVWRQQHHSRWARIWQRVKEVHPQARIWYHSDGNILDIVPQLIESGLDVLNPVQPECVDLDELYRRHGDRLTFDGCVGTQSTMPYGTPADVRECVRNLITKYGRNGGLMIAPTHVLEPEVPLANIDALFEACREFGAFE